MLRSLRKTLSAPGLIGEVRGCFQAIKDETASRGLTLVDCLLSGLAVFGLKYPSLLQFDRGRADALAANGPHIELLESLKLRYILGVKPGDHTFLFHWVATTPGVKTAERVDQDGTVHRFRYLNGVPLNESHFDLEVNVLDYVIYILDCDSQRIREF